MNIFVSFLLSFLLYVLLIFLVFFMKIAPLEETSYTDNQSIVKLIQGSIISQDEIKVDSDKQMSNISKSLLQNDDIDKISKPSNQTNEIENLPKNVDPFDNLDVVLDKNTKLNSEKKLQKKQALNKALEYANKSISDTQKLQHVNVSAGGKHGNSSTNAMPGKYDRYKGMVNRKLNEIWSLYRPREQNMIRVKVRIKTNGFLSILEYEKIKNRDFMNNINKFFDKIKAENFGTPPDGKPLELNLLLQTNKVN